MPRKRNHTPPQSVTLSVEQMQAALVRLELRLRDLRAFDPSQVTARDDPSVTVLGNAIDDFLTNTFGKESAEYDRYSPAIYLDTAPVIIGQPMPLHEIILGLKHGQNRAIAILEGIQQRFQEEIAIASPDTTENEQPEGHANADSREVFVVHGSDHGMRNTVARYLEQLDLLPIILDEQSRAC